jgi:hypothetical protein
MAVSLAAEGRLTPETGQAIRFAGTTYLYLISRQIEYQNAPPDNPADQTPQKVSKHTYPRQYGGQAGLSVGVGSHVETGLP